METEMSDLATAPSRTREFLDRLPLDNQNGRRIRRLSDGSVAGDWFGCALTSVFQPILDSASGHTLGYEAFLRILGGGRRELSPWVLFSANADDNRLIALDRLARTLHTLNFLTSVDDGSALLFLNVHGRLLAAVEHDHGAAFRRVLDALGVAPARIVIEAPLATSSERDLLSFTVRNYRRQGFRTAVNLESAVQWRELSHTTPAHYVKIDASRFIADSGQDTLAHWDASGSAARLVLTRAEQRLRIDDKQESIPLVQGYAYGAPEPRASSASAARLAAIARISR